MKKNFFKFTVSAVTASLILLAAGCSNVLTTATVSGSDDSAEKNAGLHSVNLHITASANEGVMKLPAAPSASSRNIHGATLTSSELNFYLFTKKKGDTNFSNANGTVVVYSPNSVNVGDSGDSKVETGEGTITLNLEDSYYDLCLLAVKKGAVGSDFSYSALSEIATLKGETSADLREANVKVHFYMIPDGLSGPSNVTINLTTAGWNPAGFDIKASIVNYADGKPVAGIEEKTLTAGTSPTETSGTDYSLGTYSVEAITPGTYTFQVAFTQKSVTNPKTFYYSESIDILPKHDISASRAIPDIVLKVPEAPTDLHVAFKDPVNNTSDTYYAAFEWTDGSNNETYFQLELLTVPDTADLSKKKTDTSWGNSTTPDKYTPAAGDYIFDTLLLTTSEAVNSALKVLKDDFVGNESQMWYKGSLLKNNKAVAVKLELGKRYLARICAVNDAGSSSYAYVDLSAAVKADVLSGLVGNEESAKYNRFAYSDAENGVSATSINRYRLAYNLMGGTLTYAGDTTPATATGILYEYRTENTVNNATEGTYVKADSKASVQGGSYKAAAFTSAMDVLTADIMNPTCDTTTITSLIEGGKTWKYWKWNATANATATTKWTGKTYTDASITDYNPIDYTGFKNLILEACYSTDTADLTSNQHVIANIDDESIKVSSDTEKVVGTLVKKSFTYNATEAKADSTVKFTIEFTATQKALGVKYDSVTVSVINNSSGTVVKTFPMTYSKENNTWTASYNMSDLAQSKYTIKFEAKIASHASNKYSGVYDNTIYMEIIEP